MDQTILDTELACIPGANMRENIHITPPVERAEYARGLTVSYSHPKSHNNEL